MEGAEEEGGDDDLLSSATRRRGEGSCDGVDMVGRVRLVGGGREAREGCDVLCWCSALVMRKRRCALDVLLLDVVVHLLLRLTVTSSSVANGHSQVQRLPPCGCCAVWSRRLSTDTAASQRSVHASSTHSPVSPLLDTPPTSPPHRLLLSERQDISDCRRHQRETLA